MDSAQRMARPRNEQIDQRGKEDDKQKEQNKQERVGILELYRFADGFDYLLLALGIIFAMVAGCSFPWFAYLWGKILDAFLNASDAQVRLSQAIHYRNIFFYLGLGALVTSWISFAAWSILSERMAVKCRKQYMKSLLRQDIGWFDQNNQFQLSAQFNQDALAYQRATGQKIGSMFNLFAMFACGFAISLSVRWTMSLVIFASFPIIGAGCIIFIYLIHKKNSTFQELYQGADSCSHQALNSIKTVKGLNGQQFQQNRYRRFLDLLKQKVLRWAIYAGIGTGIFFFVQYCAFSFGFWYGTHCVAGSYRCPLSVTGSVYTPGQQTIVFFALFVGSFNFMQLLPNILTILQGLKAAKRLYKIIDLQPTINKKAGGLKFDRLKGKIQFQNVTFAYPKAKDHKILRQLSFSTNQSASNAFVGDTGSGKSTIFQLVMRFYDPDAGRVLLDGHDLRQYDLQWLRTQIGYVGQEPCLFEGTIYDNLRIGKSNATQQEIYKALDRAQARDFVQNLPGRLNYNVGYGGSNLSGGQKQRIAIARAIIKNPQILILDEATSALDRRNEKLIQETLDRISQGLTTLVIAHRVKTVMNSSKIFVIRRGVLHEQGRFKQLQRFRDLQIDVDEVPNKQVRRSTNQQSNKVIVHTEKTNQHVLNEVQNENSQYQGSVYGRLFSYTEGKRCLLFIGIIACIIAGAVHPCSALLLANILNEQFNIYPRSIINNNSSQVSYHLQEAEKYVLYLFFIAIFIFFPFLIQSVIFTLIGEQVTQKIRIQVYNKLLRLPIKWFERRNNQGAATANKFGIDARQVNGLTTSLVSTMTMNFSSIIIGMIFAFIFQWRLGLVGLVAMPCMVIAGFISMLFYGGFGDKNKIFYEQSSRISQEAILNIRTVNSFGYETHLQRIYDEKLQYPLDSAFGKGTKLGLLYGFSQLILQYTFGVLFYFGALIMRDNPQVKLLNILYAIMSITWAGWYSGNNFYFMPDVVAGKTSAQNLLAILDTEDEHQIQIKESSKFLRENGLGKLQFRNVSFSYNNKSDPILNGINLSIEKGQKVAFVGPSGCGKSTIIQLIQRFYDYQGEIFLNGKNIKDYDIKYLRSICSTVNQEPSLFSGSISENINYNTGSSEAQIRNAAEKSQANTFINQNPKGFDRDVGILGSQLSGGQKQRVAIARSIIRKPYILILDEATSALDRNTEKKVQSNIDNQMRGKVSIVIAHRIETIMNSSHIYLFDKGDIIEDGTYNQLMSKKRYFYNLQRGEKMQSS